MGALGWQGGEKLQEEEFSELYAVTCVMENLPIKPSVKSTLLTNASGESGGFPERAKGLRPAPEWERAVLGRGVCGRASATQTSSSMAQQNLHLYLPPRPLSSRPPSLAWAPSCLPPGHACQPAFSPLRSLAESQLTRRE